MTGAATTGAGLALPDVGVRDWIWTWGSGPDLEGSEELMDGEAATSVPFQGGTNETPLSWNKNQNSSVPTVKVTLEICVFESAFMTSMMRSYFACSSVCRVTSTL